MIIIVEETCRLLRIFESFLRLEKFDIFLFMLGLVKICYVLKKKQDMFIGLKNFLCGLLATFNCYEV